MMPQTIRDYLHGECLSITNKLNPFALCALPKAALDILPAVNDGRMSTTVGHAQKKVKFTGASDPQELIDLIVKYLTENGVMDAARLYESPFTDVSQQGPEALFLPAKVTEMVQVLEEIRARAVA